MMSSDVSALPVYGPPKRNNYAEWKRECPSERPITATVQASKDRFQKALLGCHLPPTHGNVDGAVAASLTFREQKPPKPPLRCPDRTEAQCKPQPHPEASRDVKRYSVCEKTALQQSYRKHVKTSHPPPQFLGQHQRRCSPCPQRDDKVSVPPYVVPDRPTTGIPVRAATDCVYQYIRSTTKDGPRPPPLKTTLLHRGDVCDPSQPCPRFEPLQAVAERRCAKAGQAPTTEKPPPPTAAAITAPKCQPVLPKPLPCGLTGVAEPYLGGPPFVAAVKPDFLPQARPAPPCPEVRHPGITQVPPFIWPLPHPGTRIRACTDCLPKRLCPGDPPPVPPENCAHFSPICKLGYFGQLINEPCVYPCCVSQEQSEQLAREMKWTTMARTQMEELKYPPRHKLATPTTTYEERADRVKYRMERYEPAASLCQQVPDVWDRAQTREMMDHVVGDSDYVQKVNEVLPTGDVMRNNKMVMKPCMEPSRYCIVSRDINIETPCKVGPTHFVPDVSPANIVYPSCV